MDEIDEIELAKARALLAENLIKFGNKPKTRMMTVALLEDRLNALRTEQTDIQNFDLDSFLEALIYYISEHQSIFKDEANCWECICEAVQIGLTYE